MRKAVLSLTVLTTSKRMTLTLLAASLVGMALLFGVGIRSAETQTTAPKMQDLGTLPGGSSSYANGINDSGQVVGYSDTSDGSSHAFLYDEEATLKMQDLGTLPGGSSSRALGINDSGQVVGYSDTESGEWHAFLYDESATPKMQDLNDLIPADFVWNIEGAAAINSDGKIAAYGGYSYVGYLSALVLTPATTATPATYEVQDLGTLLAADPLYYSYSYATGINASGQVVGTARYACSEQSLTCIYQRAFLYDEGATPKMQDLGFLGGNHSHATGINASGQVAGSNVQYVVTSSTFSSYTRALLYDDGTMQNLGSLGGSSSYATGINDSGQVVGYSDTSDGVRHAFLKEGGQPMSDLNTLLPADPGWTIDTATAINTDGKIAANGYKDGVGTHALLLTATNTPVSPDTTITSGPTDTVSSRSATFAFSSTESTSTFECSLDGGGWTKCTSPTTYDNLADGNHTFQVRAIGAAGNVDDTPASQSWTVDATAPNVDRVTPSTSTGVSLSTPITATFSEDMDPNTLTTNTFTLTKQGSTTPLGATVSYDAKTATLKPSALNRNITYTATVKGGANGAKDKAGNALASDKVWTFTTSNKQR